MVLPEHYFALLRSRSTMLLEIQILNPTSWSWSKHLKNPCTQTLLGIKHSRPLIKVTYYLGTLEVPGGYSSLVAKVVPELFMIWFSNSSLVHAKLNKTSKVLDCKKSSPCLLHNKVVYMGIYLLYSLLFK